MYLSTYTELCQISISGITFVGRNSSSATRMRGSKHSPTFILQLNEFEDLGIVWNTRNVFINYSKYILWWRNYFLCTRFLYKISDTLLKFCLRSQVSSFKKKLTYLWPNILVGPSIPWVAGNVLLLEEKDCLQLCKVLHFAFIKDFFLYDKGLSMNRELLDKSLSPQFLTLRFHSDFEMCSRSLAQFVLVSSSFFLCLFLIDSAKLKGNTSRFYLQSDEVMNIISENLHCQWQADNSIYYFVHIKILLSIFVFECLEFSPPICLC